MVLDPLVDKCKILCIHFPVVTGQLFNSFYLHMQFFGDKKKSWMERCEFSKNLSDSGGSNARKIR